MLLDEVSIWICSFQKNGNRGWKVWFYPFIVGLSGLPDRHADFGTHLYSYGDLCYQYTANTTQDYASCHWYPGSIPSVVYGVWGLLVIVPLSPVLGPWLGIKPWVTAYLQVLCARYHDHPLFSISLWEFLYTGRTERSRIIIGTTEWQPSNMYLWKKLFPYHRCIGFVWQAFGRHGVLMVVGNVVNCPTMCLTPDILYLPDWNNYGECCRSLMTRPWCSGVNLLRSRCS